MEKSKLNSLLKRILTALILVPVTIFCLWAGYPFIQLFALVTGALLAWEWARMVPSVRGAFYAVSYTAVMASAVALGSWTGYWIMLAGGTLLVWFKARGEAHRNLLVLGVPYISVGIGSLIWLYELAGLSLTLWYVLVVWAVDVGGYVFGCSIKGPKLAPSVSPNKTWSGLLGGMFLSFAVSSAYLWGLSVPDNSIILFGAWAAAVAVVAQIGDLVESAIKRRLNLKDSSDLIPGHGGVFDRVDGLIFAAPFVFLFVKFMLN